MSESSEQGKWRYDSELGVAFSPTGGQYSPAAKRIADLESRLATEQAARQAAERALDDIAHSEMGEDTLRAQLAALKAKLTAANERAAAAEARAGLLLQHIHRVEHNWLPYEEADCEHCQHFLEEFMPPAPTQDRLVAAAETAGLARKELRDIQEQRCTCPGDYYYGDHHYKFCPAADESKAASRHLAFSLNRVAYHLNRILPPPASTEPAR